MSTVGIVMIPIDILLVAWNVQLMTKFKAGSFEWITNLIQAIALTIVAVALSLRFLQEHL